MISIGVDSTSGLPVWLCKWKREKAWGGRGKRINGCFDDWTLRTLKSLPGVDLPGKSNPK